MLFAALCSGKAREGLIWPSIGRSKREKHNQTKLDFLQKSFSSASIVDGIETSSVLRQKDGLKTGSDKIIYWLGRYSFLLGVIMSKKPKGLWFYVLIESSVRKLSHFLHNKTQKERACTESEIIFNQTKSLESLVLRRL